MSPGSIFFLSFLSNFCRTVKSFRSLVSGFRKGIFKFPLIVATSQPLTDMYFADQILFSLICIGSPREHSCEVGLVALPFKANV